MTVETPDADGTIGRCVVAGVDGSPESREAAILARRLTDRAQGSLHLATAASQTLVQVAATRAGINRDRLEEGLLEAAAARARARLRGDFSPTDLDTLIVRIGRPETVLAEASKDLDADAVVLGGGRRRPPGSWLGGRVARRLFGPRPGPGHRRGARGKSAQSCPRRRRPLQRGTARARGRPTARRPP